MAEDPDRQPSPGDSNEARADAAIASLGRTWEFLQSLWIALPLLSLGYLTWLAFLYAGLRSRQRSYLISAAAYAAGVAGFFIAYQLESARSEDQAVAGFIAIGNWLGGTIHAIAVRRSYVRALALRHAKAVQEAERLREEPLRVDPHLPAPEDAPTSHELDAVLGSDWQRGDDSQDSDGGLIDLNRAGAGTLERLGISRSYAREAIRIREKRGGFTSVDDFAEATGIAPHLIELIRPQVCVNPPPRRRLPHRIVDA